MLIRKSWFDKGKRVLIIELSGKLDVYASRELEGELAEKARKQQHIVADLSDVPYVSSSGLRVFLTLLDELQKAGVGEEEFLGFPGSLLNIMDDKENPWFDDVRTKEMEDRDDILRRSAQETMDFWGRRFGDQPRDWAWGRLH